jgi:hypothetical protein
MPMRFDSGGKKCWHGARPAEPAESSAIGMTYRQEVRE